LHFDQHGGSFIHSPDVLGQKLSQIEGFLFDWDGVFNTGEKNGNGSSSFNEIDIMGINMLRFSHWLMYGKIPFTTIVTGEKNASAFQIASREHFDACYFKVAHKTLALDHIGQAYKLIPSSLAFVFDDILDLSIARVCGFRFLIRRPGASLLKEYVLKNSLADYITGNTSGHYAIREICELVLALRNNLDQTLEERITFSAVYQEYLSQRNAIQTQFFTRQKDGIVSANPMDTQNA
jgi:3-deoxy-D-manno-octulosonate 8-phosphate phosphatase (KDO 8-P phosphatase)